MSNNDSIFVTSLRLTDSINFLTLLRIRRRLKEVGWGVEAEYYSDTVRSDLLYGPGRRFYSPSETSKLTDRGAYTCKGTLHVASQLIIDCTLVQNGRRFIGI